MDKVEKKELLIDRSHFFFWCEGKFDVSIVERGENLSLFFSSACSPSRTIYCLLHVSFFSRSVRTRDKGRKRTGCMIKEEVQGLINV